MKDQEFKNKINGTKKGIQQKHYKTVWKKETKEEKDLKMQQKNQFIFEEIYRNK